MSTAASQNSDNFCYRHPDRMSFVLCQRCLRTICPDCQTQSAVGVVCPECMKQQRAERTPAQRKADRRWRGGGAQTALATWRPGPLAVTYTLIAVTAFIYLLQKVPGFGEQLQGQFFFTGVDIDPEFGTQMEPWRALTALFLHGSFFHVGFNLLALLMIGRILEPLLGHVRFLALYLIAGLAGSVGMALLAPSTPAIGASGAIFGMFGALIVIMRRLGGDVTSILVVIGANLVIGFMPGLNIAWQAHIGGLIGGLLVGAVYAGTRRRDQRGLQIGLLVGIVALLIAATFLIPVLHPNLLGTGG